MSKPEPCERCGTTEGVELTTNPYQVEMHDNHEKEWLCYDCHDNIRGDI